MIEGWVGPCPTYCPDCERIAYITRINQLETTVEAMKRDANSPARVKAHAYLAGFQYMVAWG